MHIMEQELIARREQAESSFNALQKSLNAIKQELQKYGAENVEQLEAELLRLQGDYRTLKDILDKPDDEPPKTSVSKPKKPKSPAPANVIDVSNVKGA